MVSHQPGSKRAVSNNSNNSPENSKYTEHYRCRWKHTAAERAFVCRKLENLLKEHIMLSGFPQTGCSKRCSHTQHKFFLFLCSLPLFSSFLSFSPCCVQESVWLLILTSASCRNVCVLSLPSDVAPGTNGMWKRQTGFSSEKHCPLSVHVCIYACVYVTACVYVCVYMWLERALLLPHISTVCFNPTFFHSLPKIKWNAKGWDRGEKHTIKEMNTSVYIFAYGNIERRYWSVNLWAVVYGLIPQLFHFLSLSYSPSFGGESKGLKGCLQFTNLTSKPA